MKKVRVSAVVSDSQWKDKLKVKLHNFFGLTLSILMYDLIKQCNSGLKNDTICC